MKSSIWSDAEGWWVATGAGTSDVRRIATPLTIRAKREQLTRLKRLLTESQGQNLALTILFVPHSLNSGPGGDRCRNLFFSLSLTHTHTHTHSPSDDADRDGAQRHAHPGLEFEPFLSWRRRLRISASQETGHRKWSIWSDAEGWWVDTGAGASDEADRDGSQRHANPGLEFEPFLVWPRRIRLSAGQETGHRKWPIWSGTEGWWVDTGAGTSDDADPPARVGKLLLLLH